MKNKNTLRKGCCEAVAPTTRSSGRREHRCLRSSSCVRQQRRPRHLSTHTHYGLGRFAFRGEWRRLGAEPVRARAPDLTALSPSWCVNWRSERGAWMIAYI